MSRRSTEFGGLIITFDDDVLEPRAWTIAHSEWAIELLRELPDGPVLELGCGVGHIGLVVAVATGRPLVQVDDDEHACVVARGNARSAGVTSDVRCGRPEGVVDTAERFSMVLADPPYLVDGTGHAVDGGPDGLAVAREWLDVVSRHVTPNGRVLFQIGGQHQAEALVDDASARGLEAVETRVFRADRALVLLSACT